MQGCVRSFLSSMIWPSPSSTLFPYTTLFRSSYVGIFDFATGNHRYLDPAIYRDQAPVWSPDGTKLAFARVPGNWTRRRSEEHTSELQSRLHLVCRLLLEKKNQTSKNASRSAY